MVSDRATAKKQGAFNLGESAGQVAETRVSVERGFYESPVTVEIQCATPDAIIRYTTDGSEPGESRGVTYKDPIEVGKTVVLRAAASKQGWSPSRISTHTYVFPKDVIASQTMRTSITKHPTYGPRLADALRLIPSISLVTSTSITQSQPVRTSFEWLGSDGQKGVQEDCAVVHFGGAYTKFEKESFRLYFRSEFGASKLKFPVFKGHEHGLAPVEEFDQLELRSGSHDMVQRGFYMSNMFADDTMLEMGQLNPHGRFVHLYLEGVYWGVYHLRERWSAGMHHRYLGGSSADYESINGNLNVGGWAPGVPYDGDGSVWKRVQASRDNYQEVRRWVDLPQYIDFMIVWIFGRCEDEYRCVGPTVPGSGFKFYINDADGFFQSPANPWYGEPSNRTASTQPGRVSFRGRPNRQPGDGPGGLFSALLAQGDSDYLILLADRIYKALANGGALTPARTAARLRLRCKEIEVPFIAESARWGYRRPSSWESVRDDVLNQWLPARTQAVLAQLQAAGFYPNLHAPTLNQQGGEVRSGFQVLFTGPSQGTIVYTVDGSDPRLPGGGVAPGGKIGRASVPGDAVSSETGALLVIDRNTVLRCRARDGSQWSALNESFFQVSPEVLREGQVVIKGFDLVPGKDNGAECIELSNVSAEPVNLRGAHFSEGIQYAFPDNRDTVLAASQKLVLVRDLLRFRQTHGLDVAVEGIYSRKTKENLERVTLSSVSGKDIATRLVSQDKP